MENNELKTNEGEVQEVQDNLGETEKPASPLDAIKLDKKSLEIANEIVHKYGLNYIGEPTLKPLRKKD